MELRQEVLNQEQTVKAEKDFFEEGETIKLRDGKIYTIPPLLLKDARKLMQQLNNIDPTLIIMNFVDDRIEKLYEVLMMAFKYNYPEITMEELEDICDLRQAKQIIEIMTDINGIKKLMPV